ncbi:glycosyltransferase family 10 [Kamptonema sp. UHCC 0994]|uniref:glycosyltransferase family 10 domain-containing protein n=1 Tax=Kamptonema sp. UHCC 0994 TaxID=3031329 RepID=UPI0023B8E3C2|nr:glycosyltransferase family 10 [Kamptonema sp. UHCC 0994]MDF0553896.1 glycosyltransferase family 10 [Kamptonema sp. UHCC 0994]
MNKKTIGMISSYPGLNQSDWLWQQTPHNFGKWGNIQMLANSPQPDFLLMYQFDFPKLAKKQSWLQKLRRPKQLNEPDIKTKLRGAPKERIVYLIREPPLDEIIEITKSNYEQAKNYCGYVSGPDDFAPTPDYMPAIWYHPNSFRELNEMPPPEKTKLCSWITSGISRTANHRRRLDFIKLLQEQELNFDLYGRNLPVFAKTNGSVNNKWHAMAPYYYNLAIENYADNDWYVSEKLWDSLLAWCLPIYFGGSAADKLLPPGCFLRLPSLDEKGVEFIKEVVTTPDYWYAAQDAIAEARQIILHELNLLNWLSNFVTKF